MTWPLFNALLNALCAIFLVLGFLFIRQKKVIWHRAAMVSAFMVSAVFLASYLLYHYEVGSTRYAGQGLWRTVYFAILISHSILAAAIVPMILRTLYLAATNRFEQHRRLARWTLPLWFYVSITGVVIYLMLYPAQWRHLLLG